MVRTKELRSRAWENVMKSNYWRSIGFCVLIGVITTVIMGLSQLATTSMMFSSAMMFQSMSQMIFSMIFAYGLMFAVKIFIVNNFYLSWIKYFLHGAKTNEFSLSDIGYGFTSGRYMNFVKTLVLKDLCLIGWGFLFYIPTIFLMVVGFRNAVFMFIVLVVFMIALIFKYYDYSFVSYILSEDEERGSKEAIRLSKRMASSHKINIFLLDLFFWGWFLVLELVIMGTTTGLIMSGGSPFNVFGGYLVIFVASIAIMPYYLGTKAQLYLEIKGPEDTDENSKEDIVELLKKMN